MKNERNAVKQTNKNSRFEISTEVEIHIMTLNRLRHVERYVITNIYEENTASIFVVNEAYVLLKIQ